MELWKYKLGIGQLQVVVWVAVFFLIFFSVLPMDGFGISVVYTVVNSAAYAVIIYANILFLYPSFYQKGKFFAYGAGVVLLLLTIGVLRGYVQTLLYQHFALVKIKPITLGELLGYVPGVVLIYVLSLVYRIAIAYFTLKQQAEEAMLQKSQAELNLLKSQVQPHFLFNTLNSIYYRVYKVDPASAGLIERLSDIMRYFVDESPRDLVSLATEVQFIENYMTLERNRIRHGVAIDFEKAYNPELRLPPMLLMTFVENVFKHGIDKTEGQSKVSLSLIQVDGFLLFKTVNLKIATAEIHANKGFGIVNLTRRLEMLYGSTFELKIDDGGTFYTASLKIPVL